MQLVLDQNQPAQINTFCHGGQALNLPSNVINFIKRSYSTAEIGVNTASQVECSLQVNTRCQQNESRQVTLLLFGVKGIGRLDCDLHCIYYGRLQRWNVRPVNTEGRKHQHIWHEHYKHTTNTPKCEITKHRRHQVVLCNDEGKKEPFGETMLGDACKMRENRPWVECNDCAISACIQ